MERLNLLNHWVQGICCLNVKDTFKIRFYDAQDISIKTLHYLDEFKDVSQPVDREISLIRENKPVVKLKLPTE